MNFKADEQNEGQRIDCYLAEIMQDCSRSRIQKLIKESKILVNNKETKPSYLVKEDDEVYVDNTVKSILIKPEDIPLDIIWEDENVAVVNKPSGMLTHPTTIETTGTLMNALMNKYGEELSDINGYMRRGIVHRLDRNTSGLIMIAKNNKTHEFLESEIKARNITKKYLAVIKGCPNKDDFSVDLPIGRHPTQPQKQAVRSDGKESHSIVKVLKRYNNASLVEVTLITGRTHQIRVHMSSIGYPVYNDTLYGFGKMKIKTDEQVLQSYKLEFKKPFTDKIICLEIPPDSKIEKVLKYLSAKI